MLSRSVLSAAIAVPVADAGLSSPDSLVLLQRQADAKVGLVRGDVASGSMSGVGMTTPVSKKGFELVQTLNDNEEMKTFIERVVKWEGRVVNDDNELRGLVPYYSGAVAKQSMERLKQELRQVSWVGEGLGRTAPLNEEGYQQVAALKDRHHLMAFSRRILDANRRKCEDEGSLIGMMPYFNGAVSVQSYEKLRQELLSAPWAVDRLGTRSTAPQVSMSAKAESVGLPEAKRDARTEEFFSRVHSHVVGKSGLRGDPILFMIGSDAYLVDPKAGVTTPSVLADEWGLRAHDPQAIAETAKAKGVNLLLWASDYKAIDKVLTSATIPRGSRMRGWINGVEQDESAVRDMNPAAAVKLGLSLMWLQGGGWDGKESILQFGTSHIAKTLLQGSFFSSIAAEVRTQGHGKSECPCIGIDGNSGEVNITIDGDVAAYPADVGSRCEAWDDGRHPTACSDGGEPGKGQGFCAQKWCYVDACSCDSGLPMKATYLKKATYKGKPLYYSYATCGGEDTFSSWHAQDGAKKNDADKKKKETANKETETVETVDEEGDKEKRKADKEKIESKEVQPKEDASVSEEEDSSTTEPSKPEEEGSSGKRTKAEWTEANADDGKGEREASADSSDGSKGEWKANGDSSDGSKGEWKAKGDRSDGGEVEWKGNADSSDGGEGEWKTDHSDGGKGEWKKNADGGKGEWKANADSSGGSKGEWKANADSSGGSKGELEANGDSSDGSRGKEKANGDSSDGSRGKEKANGDSSDGSKGEWEANGDRLDGSKGEWEASAGSSGSDGSRADWKANGDRSDGSRGEWKAKGDRSGGSRGEWEANGDSSDGSKREWKANADGSDGGKGEWKASGDSSDSGKGEWKANGDSSDGSKGEWKANGDSLDGSKGDWKANGDSSDGSKGEWKANGDGSDGSKGEWKASADGSDSGKGEWKANGDRSDGSKGDRKANGDRSDGSKGEWTATGDRSDGSKGDWKASADSSDGSRGDWKANGDSSDSSKGEWKANGDRSDGSRGERKANGDSSDGSKGEWKGSAEGNNNANEWKILANDDINSAKTEWKNTADGSAKSNDDWKAHPNADQENSKTDAWKPKGDESKGEWKENSDGVWKADHADNAGKAKKHPKYDNGEWTEEKKAEWQAIKAAKKAKKEADANRDDGKWTEEKKSEWQAIKTANKERIANDKKQWRADHKKANPTWTAPAKEEDKEEQGTWTAPAKEEKEEQGTWTAPAKEGKEEQGIWTAPAKEEEEKATWTAPAREEESSEDGSRRAPMWNDAPSTRDSDAKDSDVNADKVGNDQNIHESVDDSVPSTNENDFTTEAEPIAERDANTDVPKIEPIKSEPVKDEKPVGKAEAEDEKAKRRDIDIKGKAIDGDAQVEVEMPAEEVDAELEAMCSAPIDAKSVGKSGCMCIGMAGLPGTVKVELGQNSTVDYPADVGGSCSAWDKERHPECMKTGDSVPDWCHESWCYVDPCSCNQKAVMAGKTSGYLPKSNFEGRPLYYSYKACGSVDLWTAKNNQDACMNKEEKDCSGDCLWTGSECTDQQLISVCDAEQSSSLGLRSATKALMAVAVASFAAFA